MSTKPDIYELDFGVYGVEFEVFDQTPNGNGSAAVTTDDHALSEFVPGQVVPYLGPNEVDTRPPVETVDVDDVPFLARTAISEAYRREGKDFRIGELVRMVLGKTTQISLEQRNEFRDIILSDCRVERSGQRGLFRLKQAEYDPDAVEWPYEKADVDFDKTDAIAAAIAEKLSSGKPKNPKQPRGLLGLIEGGEELAEAARSLTEDELNEVLVSLVHNHSITAQADGKFGLRPELHAQYNPDYVSKKARLKAKRKEQEHRFSDEEAHQIEMLTNGRFKQVVTNYRHRKRIYQLLTRAPRTVSADKLMFKP